jgi:CHASE2 domain-containing sensor protein
LAVRLSTTERAAPRSHSARYRTRGLLILTALFSVAFLVFGNHMVLGNVAAIELDAALRSALVSRYEPQLIVPLTLVTIDDATAAAPTPTAATWNFTAITPRDKLAQMLGVVAAAGPAVIVLDVDLSDPGTPDIASMSRQNELLEQFLRSYDGAPLILVKRADAVDGQVTLAADPNFDPIVATNTRLSWAHALYSTDSDGAVRTWNEWLVLCSASGPSVLPSVPLQVLSIWPTSNALQVERPRALTLRRPCRSGLSESRSHIVIYDEALSGRSEPAIARNVSRVSAWELLDPHIKREDKALFAGRAVLIGGTRTGSADSWKTPVGTLAGVELMANTVRFAPGQLRESGHTVVYTLLLFIVFCFLRLLLRPVVTVLAAIAVCALALRFLGPYAVLDAIQNAIILFAELCILEECMHLWFDARAYGSKFLLSPDLRGDDR